MEQKKLRDGGEINKINIKKRYTKVGKKGFLPYQNIKFRSARKNK